MELVRKMGKNKWGSGLANNRHLRLVKGNKDNGPINTVSFVNDFADIVHTELKKSLFCIDLVNQDIAYYQEELRFQLKARKEFWCLVPPSKDCKERTIEIMNKIVKSRQAIKDCEERIAVIRQRVALLQAQLAVLI